MTVEEALMHRHAINGVSFEIVRWTQGNIYRVVARKGDVAMSFAANGDADVGELPHILADTIEAEMERVEEALKEHEELLDGYKLRKKALVMNEDLS